MAGLELTLSDLPLWYPFEMTRALALLWLFSGLYPSQMYRLRMGCVQPCDAHYLIEVPTEIKGKTFSKRIARYMAEAIQQWEEVRPHQVALEDDVTGERVEFLFAYHDRRISGKYIHRVIIPALCRKAGVAQDHPFYGAISTFRARVTIALALLNETKGMTDLELHMWLQNKQIQTTFHLLRARTSPPQAGQQKPTSLDGTQILDRVLAGDISGLNLRPDDGEARPDLGVGRCAHPFHDECPNSRAFSQQGLYDAQDAVASQLLAAKADLKRIQQQLGLPEQESAIIEEGIALMDKLHANRTGTG